MYRSKKLLQIQTPPCRTQLRTAISPGSSVYSEYNPNACFEFDHEELLPVFHDDDYECSMNHSPYGPDSSWSNSCSNGSSTPDSSPTLGQFSNSLLKYMEDTFDNDNDSCVPIKFVDEEEEDRSMRKPIQEWYAEHTPWALSRFSELNLQASSCSRLSIPMVLDVIPETQAVSPTWRTSNSIRTSCGSSIGTRDENSTASSSSSSKTSKHSFDSDSSTFEDSLTPLGLLNPRPVVSSTTPPKLISSLSNSIHPKAELQVSKLARQRNNFAQEVFSGLAHKAKTRRHKLRTGSNSSNSNGQTTDTSRLILNENVFSTPFQATTIKTPKSSPLYTFI